MSGYLQRRPCYWNGSQGLIVSMPDVWATHWMYLVEFIFNFRFFPLLFIIRTIWKDFLGRYALMSEIGHWRESFAVIFVYKVAITTLYCYTWRQLIHYGNSYIGGNSYITATRTLLYHTYYHRNMTTTIILVVVIMCCRIVHAWASCQIHKITGYACARNVGNVFPSTTG